MPSYLYIFRLLQVMTHYRVVLIEDHDLTRNILQMSLNRTEDIEVIGTARDGQEGLDLVLALAPDVALVDLGLPSLDGIEVTRQIKAKPADSEQASSDTKVVVLTLQDNEDSVLAAFAAGADSYCMKDAAVSTLAEVIQVTGSGNSWVDPAIAGIVLSKVRQLPVTADEATTRQTVEEGQEGQSACPLTERELEVLQLIVNGYSNAAIAEELFISVGTVKTHVRHILTKLSADDRTQAAVRALRSGYAQ